MLNVTHNQIKAIPKGTFPKLYELHTLDFSYNRIKTISPAVFQPLLSLRSINLSHNALEDLKSTTFGTLPTVLELLLNDNSIKKINAAAFVKMSSLSRLDLTNNHIVQIPTIPISLSSLIVSRNKIQDVGPDRAWPSMNALLSLDLSNNQLGDSLNSESFSKLLSLQSLILDYNSITKPPAVAVSKLVSTRHLSLRVIIVIAILQVLLLRHYEARDNILPAPLFLKNRCYTSIYGKVWELRSPKQ